MCSLPGDAPSVRHAKRRTDFTGFSLDPRDLANAADFVDVPAGDPDFKRRTSGRVRDSEVDLGPGFVVRDGSYVSARWPGDAHAFAHAFADLL
jgi:hypothetical protein